MTRLTQTSLQEAGQATWDSQVIGPVCVDVNVDAAGQVQHVVGGAAICAAAAAASLGHRVQAVLSLGSQDQDLLSRVPAAVDDVHAVLGQATSSIRNVYRTADQERRTSYALAQADPLGSAEIPTEPAAVQHLAGLVVGDYAPDLIHVLAERGPLAVDMQGFVRRAHGPEGLLNLDPRRDMADVYPVIRYLKVDTAEGECLTGLTDRTDIAKALFDQGASEVMVSNAKEIMVINESGIHTCPLRPRSLIGRTGRGDTVFSAYITERNHHGLQAALLNACATVSYKMERPGPLDTTRAELIAYRDQFYADLITTTPGIVMEGGQ